jgi:hypothetical protein
MSDGLAGKTPVAPTPVDDVDVIIDCAPAVNYAMQQNDVPLIRRVVVRNLPGHEAMASALTPDPSHRAASHLVARLRPWHVEQMAEEPSTEFEAHATWLKSRSKEVRR